MAERHRLLIVLGAVAIAYATALGATFHFDDAHAVVENSSVHGWRAWAASMPGIRPLTKASYTFNWTLSPGPAGFVLFNVVCHAASAMAVLLLAQRWLSSLAPTLQRRELAALIVALLFALHPAQTEAVTYIGGRSVVLSGCFYLWAFVAFERARELDESPRRRWIAVSLVLFALAMGARETAWTLPFALILLQGARGEPLRAAARRTAPFFVVLVIAAAAIVASPVYRRLFAISLEFRSPLANLYAQVEAVAYLVTHPLLTLRVNFDPDVTVPLAAGAHWCLAAAGIVGAIAIGFAQLRQRPWLGVGILWFFLQLVPTNGLIARYDLVNDRQLHLAMVGPALLLAVALVRLLPSWIAIVAASALAAFFGLATLVRNTDYASELALWQATVRASPGKARPWNNFGFAQQQLGDIAGARAAYERALAVDPAYYKARLNLDTLEAR